MLVQLKNVTFCILQLDDAKSRELKLQQKCPLPPPLPAPYYCDTFTMYDNQMSVFTQQMDCEPKLQECNKRTDGFKAQVAPVAQPSPLLVYALCSELYSSNLFQTSTPLPFFPHMRPAARQVHRA